MFLPNVDVILDKESGFLWTGRVYDIDNEFGHATMLGYEEGANKADCIEMIGRGILQNYVYC